MTENNTITKINNSIVRYKPDSVKVVKGALYNVRISQSGTSRVASNFVKGDRVDKISLDLLNNAEGRKATAILLREEEGIVSISVESDDMLQSISQGGSSEDIEYSYGSEGDITGITITGVLVESKKAGG